MSRMPRRYWREMTTEEFSSLDPERTIAVLPVAAIEQHGPHLPVCVDACINEGILSRAVGLLPDDLPVTVLPMVSVGKSSEHAAYPGTLTLSTETLLRVLMEIGESVHRAGVRKLVLFNSHGGQPQVLDLVARDLRVRFKLMTVAVNCHRLSDAGGLFSDGEVKHGIHAGDIETSIMLHLRPDLVRTGKLKRFETLSTDMEEQFEYLTPEGAVGFGWQIQDLNAEGACGDASGADAEKGRKLVDQMAGRFVDLLKEVDRFSLNVLKERD